LYSDRRHALNSSATFFVTWPNSDAPKRRLSRGKPELDDEGNEKFVNWNVNVVGTIGIGFIVGIIVFFIMIFVSKLMLRKDVPNDQHVAQIVPVQRSASSNL
jgi:hypothetical protein